MASALSHYANDLVGPESCSTERLWISVSVTTSWPTQGDLLQADKSLEMPWSKLFKAQDLQVFQTSCTMDQKGTSNNEPCSYRIVDEFSNSAPRRGELHWFCCWYWSPHAGGCDLCPGQPLTFPPSRRSTGSAI